MKTTAVREKPILFSAEMVRAILDDRKSMTRRVVKPQPSSISHTVTPTNIGLLDQWFDDAPLKYGRPKKPLRCPYGQPGTRLWVRERWALRAGADNMAPEQVAPSINGPEPVWYAADLCLVHATYRKQPPGKWRPSIHMPRWASRLTLEITAVRVERLQEIGRDGRKAADVLAEGISQSDIDHERKWFHPDDAPTIAFSRIWDALNAKRGFPFKSNPFVWVISFRRISREGE